MRTKRLITIVIYLVLALTFLACGKIKHPSVQEYLAGKGNVQGNVNTAYFLERDERFEIGADVDGYAVFKKPSDAYRALLEAFGDGLALIQEEFDLDPVLPQDFQDYKTYGWQVTLGSAIAKEQARFISSFFDIYENSFGR